MERVWNSTVSVSIAAMVSWISGAPALAQVSNELASDSVQMVAGLDLGLNRPASSADYEMAMYLLSMGLELDPNDADMARQVVEAAWGAGDTEVLIEATRQIIRNDPKDTVAQLRLISAMINRAQTVEDRIAGYERFLTDQAKKDLEPSVRSRLMLDQALLERERGNEPGFLNALRGAAKLDPSNKEAQSLVLQHYSQTIDKASTLMRLQLRVLYADPLDPHVHIAIARMCASEGATDAAWRFLNNGINIFRIGSGQTPAQLQEQQLSLLWQYEGPQAILDRLNPSLADERATNAARIKARIEANEPYDDILAPEEIRYEPGIDRIRLLAAWVLKDQKTVDSVLLDLQRGLASNLQEMKEQMKVRGVNRAALMGDYLIKVVTYQTMRAIVGVDQVMIAQDIEQIIEYSPELGKYFRPFEPFSEYASGNYEQAIEVATDRLAPSAARDLLIALSTEQLEHTDEAIERYIQLTRNYPFQASGAIARSRLKELTNGTELKTEEGVKMEEIASRVPDWFDKMITNPENTMSLRINPSKTSYAPGESPKLSIRISNLSTLPLALGSSHPIDSNFLIIPGFREIDGKFKGTGRSNVLDLGRRFRLKPLEEFIIEVDPDTVQTRWLIQNQPQSVVRQRWRALQGFQPSRGGGLVNSPFGLVSETQLVERRVLGEASIPAEALIAQIGSDDPLLFQRAVMGAAAALLKPTLRSDLTQQDYEGIVSALWDRYESGDTPTRVWMLGKLPIKLAAKPMAIFDERAQQSLLAESLVNPDIDPVLVAMVLMTRVESAGSPVIEVARTHSDPRLGVMASMIAQRIETLEPMYAGTDKPFEAFSRQSDNEFGL